MKNKEKRKYGGISAENLQEFDECWDYEKNPHPTAADYLVWLVEKDFDEDADEAKAKILDSLSGDGAEVSQAMSKLVEIETKKVALQKTLEDVETFESIENPEPEEDPMSSISHRLTNLELAVGKIHRTLQV